MSKKNKKVVTAKKVNKKVVTKNETTIDPEVVAKAKEKARKREAKNNVPAPEKLPTSVGGVANPIVESSRKKRALAVALGLALQKKLGRKLTKDDSKDLAVFVRDSGIPFVQISSKKDAKSPELLNKSEWSGFSYAGYAIFQITEGEYAIKRKDVVDSCMEFATAMVNK